MDFTMKLSFCVSLLLVLCSTNVHGQQNIFKVTDFGAIADGRTDNGAAFMKTWEKACATSGGVVLVPLGTFLVKSQSFEGPCNGATLFQLQGNLIAAPGSSTDDDFWIQFYNVDGLKVFGRGTFDGQGATAWPHNCGSKSNCNLPPGSIKLVQVKNSKIRGIKSVNSKGFHFHIVWCDNLVVTDIDAIAPADSPNTDGIHIGKSNLVKIMNSNISTGDDCVSIGDGSRNINITGVHCGPGHGISIGSLGKYKEEQNVIGITVNNCTLTNTDNGLRIKTFAPSSIPITVSDVTFSDIVVNDVKNPIIIDQYYCPDDPCNNSAESGVAIQGVRFVNVKGTSASSVALSLQCSKAKPCQDIVLSGLDMKMAATGQPTSANCSNADKSFVGETQVPANC